MQNIIINQWRCKMMNYDQFMQSILGNLKNLKLKCQNKGIDINSYLMTLPTSVFLSCVWTPVLEQVDFSSSLQIISKNLLKTLQSQCGIENLSILKKIHGYILKSLIQRVITDKAESLTVGEISSQIKELKKKWELGPQACPFLVAIFQSEQLKENIPEARKQAILDQIMNSFNMNEQELNFKEYAIQMLKTSVHEAMFFVLQGRMQYSKIYGSLLFKHKNKVFYLLSKLANKGFQFGSILSYFVSAENNKTYVDKINNILAIFLLAQCWHDFNEKNQKFQDQAVKEIWGEAFHRMLYLAYEDQFKMLKMLLNFFLHSTFTVHQQIKKALSYHLLAFNSLIKQQENHKLTTLIEIIWQKKMGNAKINKMYIDQFSQFIRMSQETEQLALDKGDSKYIKETIQSRQKQLKQMSSYYKSQGRSLRINGLKRWIAVILAEVKNFNIEKVYLLMNGLSNFYLKQYSEYGQEELPKRLIINTATRLIKQMHRKMGYRLAGSVLCKATYMHIFELFNCCYIKDHQIPQTSRKIINCYQDHQSFGFFQLFIAQNQTIDLEELINFHEKNSFQQSLQTIMNLKLLKNDFNCSAQYQKIDKFIERLQEGSFEAKVFQLYESNAKQNKLDGKKLQIIYKLIRLKSANILNNLLFNYLYDLFRQLFDYEDKSKQDSASKKVEFYFRLLDKQIGNSANKQRVRFLLQMGNIFEYFDQKHKKKGWYSDEKTVATRYFVFLRTRQNSPFFLKYSNTCFEHNYLKQALYFLQMSVYVQPKSGQDVSTKKRAIELYRRLYLSFDKSLPFIQKYLGINCQKKATKQKQSYKLSILLFHIQKEANKIDIDINLDKIETLNQQHRFTFWLQLYLPILQFHIKEISDFYEPNEINRSILRSNILYKIINAKVQMIQNASKSVNYSDNPQIVKCIEQLQLYDDQIVYYQFLLNKLKKESNLGHIQRLYLDKLLNNNCYPQLLAYLQRGLKSIDSNIKMSTPRLCYLIRLHYAQQEFQNVISLAGILHSRGQQIQDIMEMYHIQLQSRHHAMLNHTLEDSIQFINSKCLAEPLKNQKDMNKYISFYFKMFRMIFDRYSFVAVQQNNKFMQIYFKFINKFQILTTANQQKQLKQQYSPHPSIQAKKQILKDAIFYILRFVMEKFHLPAEDKKLYGQQLMTKFLNHTHYFVPYLDYLLKRVSTNNQKKLQVIETILLEVVLRHPEQCIWTVAFLKNFGTLKKKPTQITLDEQIQMINLDNLDKKVRGLLQAKGKLNYNHLNWIHELISCCMLNSDEKKTKIQQKKLQEEIPSNLIFLFQPQYYIKKIAGMRVLANGKSSPLQMAFMLERKKDKKTLIVTTVIKSNAVNRQYRLEGNIANFLKEVGLLDSDVTYRTAHLSKSLMISEFVPHKGTLKSVMHMYSDLTANQQQVRKQLSKRKKMQNVQEMRLLDIYDIFKKAMIEPISRTIYRESNSIKHWWIKVNNFVKTHAHWSYLCFILGLGDRHVDNILINEDSKLIHIDFQYALDHGLKLPFPEWVPFRLTNCLVQSLGVLGVYGLFYAEMINMGVRFEEDQAKVWKVLSHLTGPPINNIDSLIIDRSRFEKRKVKFIEDGLAKTIKMATDPQLLRLMYEGWGAYF